MLSRKNPPLHAPLQQFSGNDDSLAPAANKRSSREQPQIAGSVLAKDHRTALGMRPYPSTGACGKARQFNDGCHRGQRSKSARMGQEHLPQGSRQGRGNTRQFPAHARAFFESASNRQVPVVRSKRCATEARRAVYGQESANRTHKAELCCRCRRSEADNSVQF